MLRPRPRSRLRAALLLSAPLALWMGCFPNLEGAACETDQNCPSSQFCSAGTCREGPRPPRAATMSATASLGAPTASVGQTLTLLFTVTNTGTVVLENIAPSSVTAGGSAAGTVLSGPAPATVTRLIPGASTSFTWTVTTGATGTLTFSASALGTASDTAEDVTASAATPSVTVQLPAELEVSLAGPTTVSWDQVFTVTMTVTNRGDAPARNVLPGTLTLTKTGGANATAGATPLPVTIGGGANATFQLTFTENGTTSGTLVVHATASGTDGNSGAPVISASGASGVITVQRPAALSIASFSIPTIIGRGGIFPATLTVSNSGEATANLVLPVPDPPSKTVTGGADVTTSTTITSGSIPGGGSRTFTWTYSETGTATGTLKLATGATGKDANTGQTISAPSTDSNVAQVQAGGALAVTSFTIPASLTRGQGFTAVLVVTNSGGSTVTGVTLVAPTTNATGGAAATTSTTFAPVSIAPGANRTYTFNYTESGTGSGTLSFTTHASGTDSVSGNPVSSTDTTSNVAAVQQPAQLTATSFTAPTLLLSGSGFVLTLVVTNSGQATANGVAPSPAPPTLTKTLGADATTSDTQLPANIAGGGSATFTWNYVENGTGAGTLRFAALAAGTDANTGTAVTTPSTNSNVVNVQTPANLVVTSFTTTPTTISRGQAFTAALTVQNQGGTTANGVLPSQNPPTLNVLTGTPGASTGTTLTPVALAPSASTTFTWNYTENGSTSGTFTLTSGATGTSAIGGGTVTAPAATTGTATVQDPASLSITGFTIPSPVGTSFTAALTVHNSGQAAANNVLPTPQAPMTTGGITVTANGSPAVQNIPGGGTVTFDLDYDVTGVRPGAVQITSGAVGTDANSAATVTAADVISNPALAPIRPPPDLGAALVVSPRVAAPGSTVTVTMEVKNEGRRPAKVVPPAELTLEGPAEVELVSAPARPSLAQVAPGDTHRFEWTYRAVRHGWVTFSGAAEGLAKVTSRHLTVPAPWCAGGTSLLAYAGPARSGRCGAALALALGGSPSAAGGAGLYRYEWTPGDGLSSALVANPTATPREAETFYELAVTDADGCQARATVRAEVTDAPVVELSAPERAAPGDRVQLTRTLRCPAGGCADAWELGDGRRSTLASPVARWTDEGVHTVRYRTTDASGCEATAELPLTVGGASSPGGAP